MLNAFMKRIMAGHCIRTAIPTFIAGALTIILTTNPTVQAAADNDSLASRGVRIAPPEHSMYNTEQTIHNYWALLIGINDYQHWPKLETAVHDVQVLKSTLTEKYHFSPDRIVTLIDEDATAQRIIDTFRALNRTLSHNDALLIYYAGHGYMDEFDIGSWIPVDAEQNALNQYFATDRIHRMVAKLNARHIFLVADACFSGTLLTTRGSSLTNLGNDRFFTEHVQRTSRQVLASGNLEAVSDLGPANHSIFAYHFLRELMLNDDPFLAASELSARVAKLVTRNGEQTPQWSRMRNTGDENGEFFFLQGTPNTTPAEVAGNTLDHVEPQGGPLHHASNQTNVRLDRTLEHIEVSASGTADMSRVKNPVQAELIALKTARHLGYGKLIETLRGVKVGNASHYHNALVDNDIMAIETSGTLRGVEVIDESVTWTNATPKASVTLRVALPRSTTPSTPADHAPITAAAIRDMLHDHAGVVIDARHLPLTDTAPLSVVSSNPYHIVTTVNPAKLIDTTVHTHIDIPHDSQTLEHTPMVIRAQALQGQDRLIVTEHEAALINDRAHRLSSPGESDVLIVY